MYIYVDLHTVCEMSVDCIAVCEYKVGQINNIFPLTLKTSCFVWSFSKIFVHREKEFGEPNIASTVVSILLFSKLMSIMQQYNINRRVLTVTSKKVFLMSRRIKAVSLANGVICSVRYCVDILQGD